MRAQRKEVMSDKGSGIPNAFYSNTDPHAL